MMCKQFGKKQKGKKTNTYTVLRKDQTENFTDYLNTVDEDNKWTTEGEVKEVEVEGMENRMERGLAFLDMLSVINEDGTINTRVYRKRNAHGPIPPE